MPTASPIQTPGVVRYLPRVSWLSESRQGCLGSGKLKAVVAGGLKRYLMKGEGERGAKGILSKKMVAIKGRKGQKKAVRRAPPGKSRTQAEGGAGPTVRKKNP